MHGFIRFICLRFLSAFATMLMVSFIVFSLMELVPGNCAERYLAYKGTQGITVTTEDIRAEEIRMGLDKPYLIRWGNWVGNIVFHFDMGESCLWRVPVSQLIGEKILLSLAICFVALFFTYLIAVPIGVLSATMRGTSLDNGLRLVSYLGLALPNFLLALSVLLFTSLFFGETVTGLFSETYRSAPWSWAKLWDLMQHAWLPVAILAWSATAIQLQTVRALISDEKDKLYVTAAKARGIDGMRLLWRYPARHALGPVINSVGFDLTRIFNDLPIVAAVLVLSDAGVLLLDALAKSNDQQLAGAIILILTVAIVSLNFLTDILLAVIDPRVRKGIMA